MEFIESFAILFSFCSQPYVGRVFVSRAPGIHYFSLFLGGRRKVFFVHEEKDRWIESCVGSTFLAKIVGYCIDCHYNPELIKYKDHINPDDSVSLP